MLAALTIVVIAISPSSHLVDAAVSLDEVTQEDSLEHIPLCSSILPAGSSVFDYCLNGSLCRMDTAPQEYARIICDCSILATQNHFYTGPQCATKVMRTYRVHQARNLDSTLNLVNTCFLEDVLGMNQWKNDINVVGPLVL